MGANENLSPKVMRELAKEIKSLDAEPPEGIRIIVNEDNFANVQAEIDGPAGTPYEGGVFRMKLVLSSDFPQVPPKGYFLTKIFHPNIAKSGEICVNTLKKDWKPTLGIRHVLLVIRCLLIEPFPESALNEEAGKMLMEDYEGYSRHAQLLTSIHALKPRAGPTKSATEGGKDGQATTPLSTDTANTDAGAPAEGVAHGAPTAADPNTVLSSPSAKKPKGETVTKLADKKKVVDRKRALKRL
ncbi:ubiquitin-conjugating enzyme [Klebsormidium nitens]|uniref:E2 ubiquitin-conjugating enzyme n=1 Tax=Klebsormidium nitens TaxID=105231 RepID=A0A1Y1I1M4_KLENI|nr:ubiquitin-conjugating enzyme [Klebsormidium nitens]|eukprot:GAQ84815.1 ubiquitin-conjugating enzyme [Klebsormidium nitens]